MKRKEHITAFYLETLLLIVVFVGIILVLTQVFGMARLKSVEAKKKTGAVCLCRNAAEAFYAAESSEELLQLLNREGNASLQLKEGGGGLILASYDTDMTPNPKGDLRIELDWETEEAAASSDPGAGPGTVRKGTVIAVGIAGGKDKEQKPIFSLPLTAYDKGGWK